ncbi:Rho family guanine nucleotide exchange factor ROM2 [Sugiyamaella lignohabitans]|uniref:Rho family guanine nucleotide exchange factor ROM2 n=1 Tax=Sugiyamaella lignohabitans TaxID=796027 RepID=A0A167DC69_9ASCO|nr:Rho family guanine nucleotide exchange factor ROM2 [Sugiyamaella lignohabitans]ANB12749.1 Rho family guanine nucleotide exchange factor ROM2 [Sugiyamaella lignohabitans]
METNTSSSNSGPGPSLGPSPNIQSGPAPYTNGKSRPPQHLQHIQQPQQQQQPPLAGQQRNTIGLGVGGVPKNLRSASNPIHPGGPFMRQGTLPATINGSGHGLPSHDVAPRSMSMTTSSYANRNNFYNNNVTLSGRVIPQRNNDIVINMNNGSNGGSGSGGNGLLGNSKGSSSSLLSSFKSAGGKAADLNGKPQRSTSTSSSYDENGRPVSGGYPNMSNHSSIVANSRKVPLVYPALLSKVAEVFRQRIVLGDRVKNELTYKNSFTGAEAVDLITYIIKTPDRNLALLLGRALDAQKFFHDVTYDHRLRDTHNECYQFNEIVIEEEAANDTNQQALVHKNSTSSARSTSTSHRSLSQKSEHGESSEPGATSVVSVNGVFTLLAECYSPTCTRDRLCYSIACPRRLEQQARLNMKPQPGLKRAESRLSLHGDDEKEQKLWIHTVAKEVADSVDDREKKRQEVICEVIYTERDFVKDLEYLRDFWIKPLRNSNIIHEGRKERFIRAVFSFAMEVHFVNSKLAEALTKRQQQAPVVRQIGDIFLEHVPKFEPFIRYGANQLYGKYEFEREKSTNPAFVKFVDETERMKESRKLELNGYLTKPTTRLARYPLLLEAVLKHTADDNPDKQNIPQAIKMIREFLTRVNIESGKTENRFSLMQLNQSLTFRPGEYVDLKLTDEKRQIIFKGALKKRTGDKDNQGDVQVYLFDNSLLFLKVKIVNKREQHKVHRKPIPLELLILAEGEEIIPKYGVKRQSSSLIPTTKTPSKAESQNRFPITFQHLGRRGYELTLYATNFISRKKWIENIENQKEVLSKAGDVYKRFALQCKFTSPSVRINCMAPSDGGRKLLFGTESGIFVSDVRMTPNGPTATDPIKLITIPNVTQLDVLDEYMTLLALSDKSLYSWPLEALDPSDPGGNFRKGKKVMGHINFYEVGICLGRMLVCTVKSSSMTSTIRVLEPFDPPSRNKRQTATAPLRRFLQSQSEGLKVFKEFYIPSETLSISFLKRRLCVGCAKGFEIVDLSSLETQSLLDPADTSLDFAIRRESLKPNSIYRLHSDFLLNYSDFSFFVNANGWRSRASWLIHWEGLPQHFALSYPYLIAFEPNFIEIRHMDTAEIVRVITGENIRFLHESTREILYVQEDERGFDEIISLDFWAKTGDGITTTSLSSTTSVTSNPSTVASTAASTTTVPPLSTSTSTATLVEHADER